MLLTSQTNRDSQRLHELPKVNRVGVGGGAEPITLDSHAQHPFLPLPHPGPDKDPILVSGLSTVSVLARLFF